LADPRRLHGGDDEAEGREDPAEDRVPDPAAEPAGPRLVRQGLPAGGLGDVADPAEPAAPDVPLVSLAYGSLARGEQPVPPASPPPKEHPRTLAAALGRARNVGRGGENLVKISR